MPLGTTKTLVADVLTAVVDMLTPYTEYTVFVVGMTEGGEGESSTIITVTTLQDGKGIIIICIYCTLLYHSCYMQHFPSVPSPVVNQTVSYNSTHITVMWQEPADPNGILQYNVSVTGITKHVEQ